MYEQKITEFQKDIAIAKEIKKKKYADKDYYNNLINRMQKLLRVYERLNNVYDMTIES